MNIILGEENAKSIEDRYVVLELDTLKIPGQDAVVKAYCVLEQLDLGEMMVLQNYRDLHHNLIENYHNGNWKFCHDAIEVLMGRWNGDLDSFYQELDQRITSLENQAADPGWSGVVDRSAPA